MPLDPTLRDQLAKTIHDAATDPRLAGLKAVVFLSLKPKGRGVNYGKLPEEKPVDVLT